MTNTSEKRHNIPMLAMKFGAILVTAGSILTGSVATVLCVAGIATGLFAMGRAILSNSKNKSPVLAPVFVTRTDKFEKENYRHHSKENPIVQTLPYCVVKKAQLRMRNNGHVNERAG